MKGLKKRGIPFTVVERDPTANYRTQGYRVRINNDGYRSLKENLPDDVLDLFKLVCAKASPKMPMLDPITAQPAATGPPGGRPGGGGGPPAGGRPGAQPGSENPDELFVADRHALRTVLMTGIPVRFGMQLDRYDVDPTTGRVHVTFKDGQVLNCDLLVGADGLHSSVRRQLCPDMNLVDTDGRCIYGKTVLTPEFRARVAEPVLGSSCVFIAREPHVSLYMEPVLFSEDARARSGLDLPQDYLYWVLVARKGVYGMEDDELLNLSGDKAVEVAKRITGGWHESVRCIVEMQEVERASALRVTSAEPTIGTWTCTGKVTLLGDAVHAMSPTGGIGANTALKDAAMLAACLAEGEAIVEAVGKYEAAMREYAGKAITMSQRGGKRMFGHPPFEECKRLNNW
ncbi:hypothetical protein HK101_002590 [Irineochytrium annulatum]|nr:hypothetical protein HK101_002590 [Irineochytrium annulatum]